MPVPNKPENKPEEGWDVVVVVVVLGVSMLVKVENNPFDWPCGGCWGLSMLENDEKRPPLDELGCWGCCGYCGYWGYWGFWGVVGFDPPKIPENSPLDDDDDDGGCWEPPKKLENIPPDDGWVGWFGFDPPKAFVNDEKSPPLEGWVGCDGPKRPLKEESIPPEEEGWELPPVNCL